MEPHEVFVINYFKEQRNLFFLDIGANDGETYSNTVNLERKYGWNGICVEANSDAFKKLIGCRKCICYNHVLYSHECEKVFYKIDGYSEMLSGLEDSYSKVHRERVEREVKERNQKLEKITVKTVRVDSLLEANNVYHVDYASIDTEGSELDILKGIDLNRFNIKLISVEDNYNEKIVNSYLESFGYKEIARVGLDNFFEKV